MTEYNNQQQHLQNDENENGSGLTLHDLLQMVLANWYWFALSVLICLGMAYYYLASTPKIYSRTATILVKDSRKGGDMELGAFSDLVGFQNRRNVDNEVYILQSHRLMSEVVKRLHLTVNYSVRDGLRTLDLYGRSPIEVDFIDDDNQRLSLEVTELEDGRIKLADFDDKYLTKQEKRRVIRGQYGDTIPTPLGQMVVHKTPFMDSTYVDRPITVTKSSPMVTTNAYRATVKSDVANKQASIVTISMNSSVPKRAEDVINTLIAVYEEDAIADKRQVSVVTNAFIKERMLAIGRELGVVDSEIEGIKKSNQMIDITSEATRSITESSKFKVEGLSIENQISVANYIRDYLNNPTHAGELIPMVASLTNNGIVAQITEYNDAILRRQKLLENSSERNPVIQDMDNVLAAVRRSIIASLNSHVSTLEIQLSNMRKEEALANHRISTMPSQEKVLLDIMRQQKIKEELFLYLLNKQEETQLNYAVAESNSRTIDQAYGSPRPVSPRSMIILGISLLAGLAIPFGIIYLIGLTKFKLEGRADVEKLTTIPIVGDIPLTDEKNEKDGSIAVFENQNNLMSETFRNIRTNLQFMLQNDKKVILVTSTVSGEGKSFISANLAISLSLLGKKVVIVGLDIRKPGLNKVFRLSTKEKGITLYLANPETDLMSLVQPSDINQNLYILPGGTVPPNPTELLARDGLDKAIEILKKNFDYVILDTAPVGMVTDTLLIGRVADLSVYVCRADYTHKVEYTLINELAEEKKLPNLCTVINGVDLKRRKYGYYYGYGKYGKYYGYGKRYGYGYGYGQEKGAKS